MIWQMLMTCPALAAPSVWLSLCFPGCFLAFARFLFSAGGALPAPRPGPLGSGPYGALRKALWHSSSFSSLRECTGVLSWALGLEELRFLRGVMAPTSPALGRDLGRVELRHLRRPGPPVLAPPPEGQCFRWGWLLCQVKSSQVVVVVVVVVVVYILYLCITLYEEFPSKVSSNR